MLFFSHYHDLKLIRKNVRNMKKMKIEFNSIVAMFATVTTYLFGGWDVALITLVVFMVLDYMTGVIIAINNKTLSSAVGMKGLSKKFLIILILIGAVCLDRLMSNEAYIFRTLVCYFYIANEGISLIENAANLGLPVPQKLREVLEQLRDEKIGKNEVK